MTVKEIALKTAAIVQADDIADEIKALADGDEPSADANVLVECVNLALAELASDGFAEQSEFTTDAPDGLIPYSKFPSPPVQIRAVRRNGAVVGFEITGDGLKVKRGGAYCVTYFARHKDKALADEVELSPFVGAEVSGYLAARNYCLMTGRSDDAAIWDQRYNGELEKLRLSRRARLPERVWGI